MFFENDFARPLFDFKRGGPARAFECIMPIEHKIFNTASGKFEYHSDSTEICGKITKTEKGMRMHLKQLHFWEEQPCLSSTEECKTEQGAPRKLRAEKPSFPRNEDLYTNKKLQKSPEMKDGELLKLMKEER